MVDDYNTGRRITVWDTSDPPKSMDPSQSMRNAPSLSMSTQNALVPYQKYTAQVYPQYNIDQRQMQQIQYQTKPSRPSKPNSTDIETGSKSGLEYISVSRVLGFLLGLIITAVPLGIIVTFYALLSTISTALSLPPQCTSYSTLTDISRLSNYTSGCCPCDSTVSTTWYRITGAAGTQLLTYPVSTGYCSTNTPGWWNGTHPSTIGATTSGTLCTSYSGYLCHPSYSINSILATNCNGYYVYYLQTISCYCCWIYPRYCTT
ncbi:unnamed protein product [Rotaria sp. Silwood1]|nr:unnamed protein product [Rotaria sp. Silwood1]CAF1352671.1 unnamed protein product [Rotaria sp. Silwood1]CAF3519268.1 unnamed protein product [Rotaria sp. Silwood1]CAF3537347.1 unnamed protein product [Rotaria sp. Silwood1]CAF4700458.1 unnamed protein product [Rotaria sp. Silwood1]